MANKKENKNGKGIDDENKTPKTDRRDIARRWNPFAWMHDMEQRMMNEFRNVGFGSWLGREGDLESESDEIEGKGGFTKNPEAKTSGWSYHFQTGMEAPEIRTWGDMKPEDVEKYLAEQGKGTSTLGPAKKEAKAGGKEKGTEGPETTEESGAGDWDPFEMFSDIFEGFSKPFFKNLGKFFGGQSEPQLGAVDAAQMEPTAETPVTPETEEVTKTASEGTSKTTSEVSQQGNSTPKGGKTVVEPFAEVLYDKDGNLVGTLEIPGATEDTLKIAVDGHTIRVEAEGTLRHYSKVLEATFKPDPKKVTCRIANGICELRAEKV